MLAPDPQTGGLRLLAQAVAGDLRVITDQPLTVVGDLRAGGTLELRAPRLSITASVTAASVDLRTPGLLDLAAGQTITARTGERGGQIRLAGDALVLAGALAAAGPVGGSIALSARQIIQAGPASAIGTEGVGGTITILTTAGYVGTTAAALDVSGARAGGDLRVDSGAGRLFSSAPMRAAGEIGGSLMLVGRDIALVGAALDASGARAGGGVLVGRSAWESAPANRRAAAQMMISPSTQIRADATASGDGGRILVWSDGETVADGSLSARGGPRGGGGGDVEISGRASLAGRARVWVDAPAGQAGHVRFDPKNLIISGTASFPQFNLVNPTPTAGDLFGYVDDGSGAAIAGTVIALSTGNVLVLDSGDDSVALNAGAAYLFNGTTGALISALTGSKAEDRVGSLDTNGRSGARSLDNGNALVRSPLWDNGTATDAGAVTWLSGTAGVSGTISASNSLVGSTNADQVGRLVGSADPDEGVVVLSSSNYVVLSSLWDDWGVVPVVADVGAATWGSGTAGVSGAISASNSLVGTRANDNVGSSITPLKNGNYVVLSAWSNGASPNVGAATWGSGMVGVSGAVSAANSLVGSTPNDSVGNIGALALANGNYVVLSSLWNNAAVLHVGAATWCNGAAVTASHVSASNSLVGSTAGDNVGSQATALTNGGYVVVSPAWSSVGAVTWGSSTTGVSGAVSASNSLVGSHLNDSVGNKGVTALTNGSYVVVSSLWDSGAIANVGAVTWGSGTTGVAGAVSAGNSLVGSTLGDTADSIVTALGNGNYVVASPVWDSGAIADVGAVTWGSGTTGVAGAVSAGNSLVGTHADDQVGSNAALALPNDNYVVVSPLWDSGAIADVGAVTWGSGSGGLTGPITPGNSLVGSSSGDSLGSGGAVALTTGSYVVSSPSWSDGATPSVGAVTWGDGAAGVSGSVSATNSLVGTHADDQVGVDGVVALSNGNYVVRSSNWANGAAANAGAVTWGSRLGGLTGAVSVDNSLVGGSANDSAGIDGVVELDNGSYVTLSSSWQNGAVTNAGAATWGSGTSGVAGLISASNSLVGTHTSDQVGRAVRALSGSSYLVISPLWNDGATTQVGAVTLSSGATGISGAVSAQNSVVGRLIKSFAESPTGSAADGSFYVNVASHDQVLVGLPDPQMITYARGQASDTGLPTDSLATLLASGAAVTLQASNDITFGSVMTVNNPAGIGGALTVQAGRSLLINAGITTDGAALTLIANDRLANGVIDSQRESGVGSITADSGALINAGTADVTVELRDGAGKTDASRGGVTLAQVTGNLRIVSGTLTPGGASVGTTKVVGNLSIGDGLNVNINSAVADQADRIDVAGTVSVAGALLISVGEAYIPKGNDVIVLISNDGSDAVIGTFSGLPEGSSYTIGGVKMNLSYRGGDGNDVVLRAGYGIYLPVVRR